MLFLVIMHIGCRIGGLPVNIIAYADDIVLLAPSWHALQALIILFIMISYTKYMNNKEQKTYIYIIQPMPIQSRVYILLVC